MIRTTRNPSPDIRTQTAMGMCGLLMRCRWFV